MTAPLTPDERRNRWRYVVEHMRVAANGCYVWTGALTNGYGYALVARRLLPGAQVRLRSGYGPASARWHGPRPPLPQPSQRVAANGCYVWTGALTNGYGYALVARRLLPGAQVRLRSGYGPASARWHGPRPPLPQPSLREPYAP